MRDNPSKHPYKLITSRPGVRGTASMYEDIDAEFETYIVGFDLSTKGSQLEAPRGSWQFDSREEAFDKLNEVTE